MSARFVVLEDHPLVREALIERLATALADNFQLTYGGADIDEALIHVEGSGCDCVILDLDLGTDEPPVSHVQRLIAVGARVLIISALGQPGLVRACLRAGALGYVSKNADVEEIARAVQATLQGEPFMSREIAAMLAGETDGSVRLSEQETQALILYASGMKMESVARRMGISADTARMYIKRVRLKYTRAGQPAPTKTDLLRRAQREGLLP